MPSVFARPRAFRWALTPLLLGLLALSGCSLHGLFQSPHIVTPQEATVTAVVRNTPDQSQCQPAIVATPKEGIVIARTAVTFVGTCWPVGAVVELGTLSHAIGGPQFVPLGHPTTVKPDGTLLLTFTPDPSLTAYVWDAHLPLVAYTTSFAQVAAVSLAVSS